MMEKLVLNNEWGLEKLKTASLCPRMENRKSRQKTIRIYKILSRPYIRRTVENAPWIATNAKSALRKCQFTAVLFVASKPARSPACRNTKKPLDAAGSAIDLVATCAGVNGVIMS